MPKYMFLCEKCNNLIHKYGPPTIDNIVCSCGNIMQKQLPVIGGQVEVREVIDPYTNIRHIKDHDNAIKERRQKYYAEVEIPRFIEKYSLETCLENKWLIYNDKGELTINKKWVPAQK